MSRYRPYAEAFCRRFGLYLRACQDDGQIRVAPAFGSLSHPLSPAIWRHIQEHEAGMSANIRVDNFAPALVKAVEKEMAKARLKWADLDKTNTADNFIALSLTYTGRATSAGRNYRDLVEGVIEGRREMLVKAIGLLAQAWEVVEK